MDKWSKYLEVVNKLHERYYDKKLNQLILSVGKIQTKYYRLEKMAFNKYLKG